MKNEDDTLLSAYIDGELDSSEQQSVEWALVAKPEVGENVRALTAVRDLVAGLHRETCADLSPQVMRRIDGLIRSRSQLSPSRFGVLRTRRALVVAGTSSAAAGIVLMATLMFFLRSRPVVLPAGPRERIAQVIAGSQPGANTGPSNKPNVPVAPDGDASASKTTAARSKNVDASHPLATEHDLGATHGLALNRSGGDQELSRRMLDNPAERRLFLIRSGGDEKTRQHVASVVEHTSRFHYFKFTVSRGIVIDPGFPDEATVFALLVNPKELDHLRDQLKDAIPRAIDERGAEPGILTQLADIDQVQKFSPVAPADVLTPREAMAFRTKSGNVENGPQPPSPSAVKALALPTPEQYRSGPVDNSDETILVLVWVCNSRPR